MRNSISKKIVAGLAALAMSAALSLSATRRRPVPSWRIWRRLRRLSWRHGRFRRLSWRHGRLGWRMARRRLGRRMAKRGLGRRMARRLGRLAWRLGRLPMGWLRLGRRLVVAGDSCDRRRAGGHLSLLGRLRVWKRVWLRQRVRVRVCQRQRLHSTCTSIQPPWSLPRPPLGERLLRRHPTMTTLTHMTHFSTDPHGRAPVRIYTRKYASWCDMRHGYVSHQWFSRAATMTHRDAPA